MSLLVKIGENDNVNITSNMTKYTSFFHILRHHLICDRYLVHAT